ncbi:MAG TPA: YCF48-related protein [Pyrinomonadaceae bacterium]|nr:YCF48-related protein [Pyrinomonadaceae bacterium]
MFKIFRNKAAITAFALLAIFNSSFYAGAIMAADTETEAPKFDNWQVVGPSGGDVRVVAIDPRDKDRLYASTLDGQIHTSADGGKSWQLLVNLNQPELVIDNMFVDSRDSMKIYASGHRHKSPGGFFRTTDGGATWKESKELHNESIHALTQSTVDPNILIAGTINGVWRSKNSGGDWEKISSATMPVNIDSVAVDPRSTETMYAGTWWRAYKTTDSGKNWRLIKNGMIDDSDVFAITINNKNPEHLVASACSGIYESQNAGEKWTKIQGIPSQSRRTRDIVQHPSVPGTIYAATTEGFWMSSTGGKTWSLTTQRDLEINSIAVHPDAPNRVFIGTNNYGVMVSNDGGRSFTQTNTNFSSRFTYFVTPDASQPNRFYAATHNTATGGGFFFVSADGGRTWQQSRGLDVVRVRPFVVRQDATNPSLMYLGTNVGIYRSVDRGTSWSQLTAAKVPAKPVKKPVVKKPVKKTASVVATNTPALGAAKLVPSITDKVRVIENLPDGKGLLVGTDKGLYRTYDVTKGWEKLYLGVGINESIFAVHVSPARPETIWAGTATSGVIVSHDGGKTWTKTAGAVENVPVSSIRSDPSRPDYVYVGTIQTFYLTRDGGKTWTRRGGGLPLGNFTSILINPSNADEIIVSSSLDTDGGMFISTDAGNKWKRVDGKDMKLASRRLWSIAFDPQNSNRIFAGTHSSGVYRIERAAD